MISIPYLMRFGMRCVSLQYGTGTGTLFYKDYQVPVALVLVQVQVVALLST